MKLTVDAAKTSEKLGDLFGIFFEDINHAADGGLYAELVQNRSFEFTTVDNPAYHALTAWEKINENGDANLIIETGNPISHKSPHYLAIDVSAPGKNVGVLNNGFNTGMPLKKGDTYNFTCYAKREQDLEQPITVSLRSNKGNVYIGKELILSSKWTKYELEFIAPETDYSGKLAITVLGRGKVYLDFVSLFPKDTFKGRKNGLRKDLAEKLMELKPKFMRFPGGCLVHVGSLDAEVRDSQYRWKNTIGPVEDRPARRNNWGYNQTLGLGYYEYFLFCDDIGTKALPVLPAGWDPHDHRAAPLNELQPFIDDALDLIEFANGDTSTVWGKKRAELGHEEPFGLEYIGIGNEEVGAEFFERYAIIHKAIKDKYPEIKIINSSGPFAAGSEYEKGWDSARENQSDLVDEHYYMAPEWFLANQHRYDDFKKEDPKVFLGEYATWGNTYYNALVEASFMIGLERNAHAVDLACYAPLFCNVDYINWKPDMIWFNNHEVYATANYYVQQLFMHHQGDQLVEINAQDLPESIMITKEPNRISGTISLSTNEAEVEYSDITFINEDTGEIINLPACTIKEGENSNLLKTDCENYTLKLKVKETHGFKGIKINFGMKDEKNSYHWLLGGWANQDNMIGEDVDGRISCHSQSYFSVEKGREYQLELKVTGTVIQTAIDGTPNHKIECKPVIIEPLYYSASLEEKTGDIIIKVVNVSEISRSTDIDLLNSNHTKCNIYTLENYDLEAVNDFEKPAFIKPKENKLEIESSSFSYEFNKQSITIFRFHQ